ncbi:DUF3618 domain-containing protein [Bradyrhizobium sp. C-145]|nr:DUF3618 domain-containing protein [Bradyrhizobium sp. C-145]UQR67842.1 DUF3618 domain-containing protein [Bradyrhizobium sp. C-145]
MTRSVEELRRESERSRAELAATVGRLKEQISDTADDIRHKVSPQHIKSEVTEYVSHKTQSWVEGLKQQIMENPMRAVAAGAAVGIPLLRMARGVPFPLLMIGAGLALTSKTVRDRAADATGPVIDKAGGMLEEVREGALAMQGDAKETLSSAQSRAAGIAGDAQDKAADLRGSAARTASVASEKLKSGMDATKDAAASVPDQARQTIGDNAALIGGLGIAIGAIIAAALPETKAEARVMGRASDEMKQAAAAAAQSGFEAAKGATTSATDAAAQKVAEADLASHASRMTQNMADTLKEAADDVVKAAFSPSQTNT